MLTQGVVPSLWIDYKKSTIKQNFKQGRAIRTETTVNNTRDFGIGRLIENLPALREMVFAANRRLLHVQQLDHDPTLDQDQFDTLTQPTTIDGQRVSGLKFGDPVVLAVLSALLIFRLLPRGFSNRDLRDHVAQLLTCSPDEFTPGRMSYQLRRLRLKGPIQRIPKTHRFSPLVGNVIAFLKRNGQHGAIRRRSNVCEMSSRKGRHDENLTVCSPGLRSAWL